MRRLRLIVMVSLLTALPGFAQTVNGPLPTYQAMTTTDGITFTAVGSSTGGAGTVNYPPSAIYIVCPVSGQPGKYGPCTFGGGGSVSITSDDSSLTVSPSPLTGTGTIDINLAHANAFTTVQSSTGGWTTSTTNYGALNSTTALVTVNGVSAFEVTSSLKAAVPSTGVFAFLSGAAGTGGDTGLSRIGAAEAALGNGTAADKSGKLDLAALNVSGLTASAQVVTDASKNLTTVALIANSTITVSTTAITANACLPTNTTFNTATMTGVASTSTFLLTPNASIAAVTGWSSATPGLYFNTFPTANTLNWQICNGSTATITPGSSTTWNVSAK